MEISIVIPLYNKENYIKRTLLSIIDTFGRVYNEKEYEIVIVDDGSKDKSVSVVESINSNVVKLYKQENGGPSKARNNGVNFSDGKYVIFCDADDIILPNYGDYIKYSIDNYPDHDVFVAFSRVLRNSKENYSIPLFDPVDVSIVDDFFYEWDKRKFFSASSICIKKHFFIQNDLYFDETISSGEDLLMFYKAAIKTKYVAYSQPAVLYDKTVDSQLSSNPDFKIGAHTYFLIKVYKTENLSVKDKTAINRIIDKQICFVAVDNLLRKKYANSLNIVLFRKRMLLQPKLAIKLIIASISYKLFTKISSLLR
ncbi:glycosyltransferase family A protein [Escherichia coli]|uniref:glycosyltransferase family A protein n=1 Tax=Escherichia coli TaxID=562 RepID=UPI00345BA521